MLFCTKINTNHNIFLSRTIVRKWLTLKEELPIIQKKIRIKLKEFHEVKKGLLYSSTRNGEVK